jgi:hypothetical protein
LLSPSFCNDLPYPPPGADCATVLTAGKVLCSPCRTPNGNSAVVIAKMTLCVSAVFGPKRSGHSGLRLSSRIPGTNGEFVIPNRQIECRLPEGPTPGCVWPPFRHRLPPTNATVGTEVHPLYPSPGRGCVTAYGSRAGGYYGAIGRFADRGVQRHLVDRDARRPMRRASRSAETACSRSAGSDCRRGCPAR